jgi:hypothetical protein
LQGRLSLLPGSFLQRQRSPGSIRPALDTTNTVAITGLTNMVQQQIANEINSRFYRLRRP